MAMAERILPFAKEQLEAVAAKIPTPSHIYAETAVWENALAFYEIFNGCWVALWIIMA